MASRGPRPADNSRSRAMRLAGLSGMGFRSLNLLVLVATTPVLASSLGQAYFGVFVTVTSLTAFLALADLGIGAGLLTALGRVASQSDERRMAALVVNAGWALLSAATVIASLGIGVSLLFDIPRILGAPPSAETEVQISFQIFIVGFSLCIPLALGSRVQTALQQGAEAAGWLALTTITSSLAAAAAAYMTGSLITTMLASTSAMAAVGLLQTTRVLRQNKWIFNSGWKFRSEGAIAYFRSSGWLFLLQISAVLSFQTDLLIVSATLGSESAAVYQGALRAFMIVTLITTALATQLWPATAEALEAGDSDWVQGALRRLSWQLPTLTALAGTLLVIFGQDLIGLWLGESLIPPMSLLIMFALWTTYAAFVTPFAQVLNGAGVLRSMALLSALMAAVNLPLSLWLTEAIGMGGPPLGSLLAHIAVLFFPMRHFVRVAIHGASKKSKRIHTWGQ